MPLPTSEEVKRPHTQMDGDEPVQKKPKHENEIVSVEKNFLKNSKEFLIIFVVTKSLFQSKKKVLMFFISRIVTKISAKART